ncbi:MAG: inorganic diphosphatase [Xanthomonadales bacterium]|nr:inorganic diphosphatase [Gammaproteobacteria bacterium]NNK03636.1 inorganic diphosphatase [Xanthomonadales bacterium]
MSLQQVPSGRKLPDDINVIIEVPMNSPAIKYEVDKDSGAIFVDRMLKTAMYYPCNYGYMPHSLCDDGDPLDILVVLPLPMLPGTVVRCRPVGVLQMRDEAGEDSKVIAVPVTEVTGIYRDVASIGDLDDILLDQIVHFFEHYKDLEKNKWVRTGDLKGVADARQEVLDAVALYEATPDKPAF